MGTGIAVTNAAALVARIRRVQDVLDRWLTELDGGVAPDVEAIRTRLQTTRDRLERPADD
jgi:hypothetical protein